MPKSTLQTTTQAQIIAPVQEIVQERAPQKGCQLLLTASRPVIWDPDGGPMGPRSRSEHSPKLLLATDARTRRVPSAYCNGQNGSESIQGIQIRVKTCSYRFCGSSQSLQVTRQKVAGK